MGSVHRQRNRGGICPHSFASVNSIVLSVHGSTCEDCPANTQTEEVAASLCSCSNGFYRSTSLGCTGEQL